MEQEKSIMFYEICRLCLDEYGHCAIYEKDGLSVDIYRCTGVKVLPADNLPQRICRNCLEIVTKATELREQAKKNESFLKGHHVENENQKETTTDIEDLVETVTSKYFQKDNKSTQEKNYAIEKFLKARMKLVNSSMAADSSTNRVKQPKSSKKPRHKKRKEHEDSDTEYEICETYYIFSESIGSETSQSESSQTPASQKLKLKTIKKKDENMNEHECDVCSKTFNTHKKLYLHQRQHNKNYCCPEDKCEKKFSSKGDMQKHLRTHTGEKPYACDMCDKSFAQRVTLRSHKENIHSMG